MGALLQIRERDSNYLEINRREMINKLIFFLLEYGFYIADKTFKKLTKGDNCQKEEAKNEILAEVAKLFYEKLNRKNNYNDLYFSFSNNNLRDFLTEERNFKEVFFTQKSGKYMLVKEKSKEITKTEGIVEDIVVNLLNEGTIEEWEISMLVDNFQKNKFSLENKEISSFLGRILYNFNDKNSKTNETEIKKYLYSEEDRSFFIELLRDILKREALESAA